MRAYTNENNFAAVHIYKEVIPMQKPSAWRKILVGPGPSFWGEWFRETLVSAVILLALGLVIEIKGWEWGLVRFTLFVALPLGAAIALPTVLLKRWRRERSIRRMEQMIPPVPPEEQEELERFAEEMWQEENKGIWQMMKEERKRKRNSD